MPDLGPSAPVASQAVMSSSLATPFAGALLANADSGSGSSILSFLFLPLILLAMYFLMIRPQRKRMKDQQNVQQSIEVGQDVVTSSGIFGTITGEDGPNRFWLEIDDENEVQIRIARAAIQNVVTPDDESDESDEPDEPEEAPVGLSDESSETDGE
jgi:preprotein translocase subunit YajC